MVRAIVTIELIDQGDATLLLVEDVTVELQEFENPVFYGLGTPKGHPKP
jgi:hypothetical protein